LQQQENAVLKPTMLLMTFGAVALPPMGGAPAPDIREWTVPWEGSRPRDPFVDPKGRVWFVGQQGNYVAYLDPVTGRFERYEVDPLP
jgi:virginiamycin B lyase